MNFTVAVLAVLFIALKVLGLVTWSWLWVLAPLWIPLFVYFVLCLFVIGAGVTVLIKA